LVGILGDSIFRRRFKLMLLLLFVAATLSCLWFALGLPNVAVDHAVWSMSKLLLSVPATLAGFFLGATTPLFYELGAELTYPLGEGVSASMLTLFINLFSLLLLVISPYIPAKWMNSIMPFTAIGCLGLMMLVREQYKRADNDKMHRDNQANETQINFDRSSESAPLLLPEGVAEDDDEARKRSRK
jgi:FLVCR family MFS transporter